MSTIDETQEPTLRHGDESMDGWVEYLRDLLGQWQQAAGTPAIERGEEFDDETLAAVRWFQTAKQLLVDGIVGNQTWAALRGEEPQPIGTDGREPGTFVESGPEARWYTEQSLAYDAASGGVYLVGFNTGAEPLDDQNFEATLWADTEEGWLVFDESYTRFVTEGGVAAMPGERFFLWFEAPADEFPGDEVKVYAQMAEHLGGDVIEQTADLSSRPSEPGRGGGETTSPVVHFAGGERGFTPVSRVGDDFEVWWTEVNDGVEHEGPYETEIRWVDGDDNPVGDDEFLVFEYDPLPPGQPVERREGLPSPRSAEGSHTLEIFLDRTTWGDQYSEHWNYSFHNVEPLD